MITSVASSKGLWAIIMDAGSKRRAQVRSPPPQHSSPAAPATCTPTPHVGLVPSRPSAVKSVGFTGGCTVAPEVFGGQDRDARWRRTRLAVMTRPCCAAQVYKLTSGVFMPRDWITEKWDKGFYITAVAGAGVLPPPGLQRCSP